MNKLVLGTIIAAAFIAGTITTVPLVYAGLDQCDNDPPQGISDGRPFLEIWAAICDLETQAGNDNDTDPTNELQTLTDNGGVTLSDGGGTVDCEDITGSADLCDGVDDVGNGAAGPVLGFYLVEKTNDVTGSTSISSGVICDSEDIAISGSFDHLVKDTDGNFIKANIDSSGQQTISNGWTIGLSWDQEAGDGSSITIGTTCADFDPPHENDS